MLNSIVISTCFLDWHFDFLFNILDIFLLIRHILHSSNWRKWWQFRWDLLSNALIGYKSLFWSISLDKLSLIALSNVWISRLKRDLLNIQSTSTWNLCLIDLRELLIVMYDLCWLGISDVKWWWLGGIIGLSKNIGSSYLPDNWLCRDISAQGITFSRTIIWIRYLCCHPSVVNNLIYIMQNKICFDYYWIYSWGFHR